MTRLTRITEKRERQRLRYSLIGIVALIIFFALFGLKILVGFSLVLDRIRGGSPASSLTQAILIAPTLDPLPQSTNQESVTLTGSGQSGLTLVVYHNDEETKKLTLDDTGRFSIPLKLIKGVNTISAKVQGDDGSASDLSDVLTITLKTDAPTLEISEPTDGQSYEGENNKATVVGKTDEGNTLTINGRFVIVDSDGTFSMTINLNEGENTFTVVALDLAENQTVKDVKVTYHP